MGALRESPLKWSRAPDSKVRALGERSNEMYIEGKKGSLCVKRLQRDRECGSLNQSR